MLKCIIIDDDQEEIDIFKMAVAELEFEVDCEGFTNCKSAFEKLDGNQNLPDFIFLDSNLSGIDGRECLQKIKSKPEFMHIPVVIFSGFLSDQEIVRYKELGALDCIIKANSLKDLQEKLNKFFAGNFRMLH